MKKRCKAIEKKGKNTVKKTRRYLIAIKELKCLQVEKAVLMLLGFFFKPSINGF